jgi:hypothetical protein
MRQTDIEILEKQDNPTLAKWWCQLNSWDWPDGLPDKENDTGGKWSPENRRGKIMGWITDLVGMKACNREWNIDRMTDEEHEEFWRNEFPRL